MSGGLANKTAVVTGAAGGIGQAIAVRLAAEGADIVVADVLDSSETEAKVTELGRNYHGAICDVSNPEDVARFAKLVLGRFRHIDILVNNAAIFPMMPFEEVTYEIWKKVFSVNVDGPFLMCKAFVPAMKQSGWGRIINMTTIGVWGRTPHFSQYVSTKGAVNAFTSCMATDLGDHGITVNAIAASLIPTPGTMQPEHAAGFEAAVQRQTIHRQGMPTDIAGTAAFLASDDASFITGQVIAVDGGASRR